jgi:hypothetical protein
MTIDAPWFHAIPTSQNRNGKYHAGKALSYITENNSTALKSSIDEGLLDCNKKVQIRGYEQALVAIAAERNRYDCGKYLVHISVVCASTDIIHAVSVYKKR